MDAWKRLQAQLRGNLANGQAWFARLTARERQLVVVAGSTLGVFLLFALFFTLTSTGAATERRTAQKLQKLQDVQLLAASYRDAEQERQSAERQLSTGAVSLTSYIEDKGAAAGIEIPTMTPKGDVTLGDGRIVESSVDITLTDINLRQLTDFLAGVERGPGVIKVKSLRLEPRPSNDVLTAWTTLSAYRMKETP